MEVKMYSIPIKNNHSFYCAEPLREDCLNFPVVGKMTEDSAGNVWICTEEWRLNYLSWGILAFSPDICIKRRSRVH